MRTDCSPFGSPRSALSDPRSLSLLTLAFSFPLLHSRLVFICHSLVSHKHASLGEGRRISSVQSLSRVRLFATPWIAAHQASLSIANSWSLLKLTCIESVMPSNHLILCRPLLLLPSAFPSIRVFSNEWILHIRWPKYWSFSFSISPTNEHPGLIFMMDWLDLHAVQGTLKSLLQHHSSKASILRCSASLWSNSHIHTWLLKKPWPELDGPLSAK